MPTVSTSKAGISHSTSPDPSANLSSSADSSDSSSGEYNYDLAVLSKKARAALAEFNSTQLIDEFALTIKELNPLPSLFPDIIKDLICMTVESPKREHHDSFCRLLGELFSNDTIIPGVQGTLLSAGDLQRAIYQFLAVLDDLLIDAPLAANHGAYIIAGLICKQMLSLRLFAGVPEDNDFSISLRAGEFIVQVLQGLTRWMGGSEEDAAALYRESAIDVKSFIQASPRETVEDVLKAYAVKYSVPFIL